MPIFFFHLLDGTDVLLDPDGRRLQNLAAVVAAALRDARAIISADAKSGTINLNQHIQVTDEGGTVVHRLRVADAVTIRR